MRRQDKTLAAAIELGAQGVALYCARCAKQKNFSVSQSRAHWNETLTFPEIAAKSRCTRCGTPGQAFPRWPFRARGGSEPLEQVPKVWGRG